MNEVLKATQRLLGDLCKLPKSWENSFCPNGTALWESYVNRDFDIVVHFRVLASDARIQGNLLLRIAPARIVRNHHIAGQSTDKVAGLDVVERNGGDREVVFVNLVQFVERPQIEIPVSVSAYFVAKERLNIRAGQGLLYSAGARGLSCFEFFPFFMERESDEYGADTFNVSNDSRRGKIQCGSQVVDRISGNECKCCAEIAFGPVNERPDRKVIIGGCNLYCTDTRSDQTINPGEIVESAVQWRGCQFELINVLIGPLNKPMATFEDTLKNLLNMKPKPQERGSDSTKSQSDKDQSSSKRATKSRKSGDD